MDKSIDDGVKQTFWDAIYDLILPAIKAFIDAGADINARNESGNSPLHEAAIRGATDVVKLLLDKGADETARNNDGHTAADVAASRQHNDVANLIDRAARRRDRHRRASGQYGELGSPESHR
ncbi:MAG: ankyrin repeat domain-containing protein [Pirellulales bacterium]|nr:ankyrin repeat domain-containing protein [Pirellulales bacterium]